jgi:UDP-perosamine 4-acetyltransferase
MVNSNNDSASDIYVLGSGGHAQSTFGLITNLPQYKFLGFYDDSAEKGKAVIGDYKVVGTIRQLLSIENVGSKLAIGLGYSLNQRASYFEKFLELDCEVLPTLIHPKARIDHHTNIAAGVHIHSGGIVRIGTNIDTNVVVNSGAIIDHEVSLSSHSMVSPGAILCGRVKVGIGSFIGAGAIILPGIEIGNSCVIGAGTVVAENVPSNMMCIGNPGRILSITQNARAILGVEK